MDSIPLQQAQTCPGQLQEQKPPQHLLRGKKELKTMSWAVQGQTLNVQVTHPMQAS